MAFVILVSKIEKLKKLDKTEATFMVPLPNVINEDKRHVL